MINSFFASRRSRRSSSVRRSEINVGAGEVRDPKRGHGLSRAGVGSGLETRLRLASFCNLRARRGNRDLNLRFRRVRTLHVAADAGIFPDRIARNREAIARNRKGKSCSLVTAS